MRGCAAEYRNSGEGQRGRGEIVTSGRYRHQSKRPPHISAAFHLAVLIYLGMKRRTIGAAVSHDAPDDSQPADGGARRVVQGRGSRGRREGRSRCTS